MSRRLTFEFDGNSGELVSFFPPIHNGCGVAWMGFRDDCCTACVADALRSGAASLTNAEDMAALADRLDVGDEEFMGRGSAMRSILRRMLAAHEARGLAEAELMVVALEAAARVGGELADRMATAIAAVFDAVPADAPVHANLAAL